MVISMEDRYIGVIIGSIVQVFELETFSLIASLDGVDSIMKEMRSICFIRDSLGLVTGDSDGNIVWWDIKEQNVRRTFRSNDPLNDSSSVYALGTSQDHSVLVATLHPHTLFVWRLLSGEYKHKIETEDMVMSVTLSPNGSIVVGGQANGKVYIWNVGSGILLQTLEGHSNMVTTVLFCQSSPTLISADNRGSLKVWNILDPEGESERKGLILEEICLLTRSVAFGDEILGIGVSPGGTWIASAMSEGEDHHGGVVRLWSLVDGEPRLQLYLWEREDECNAREYLPDFIDEIVNSAYKRAT